MITIDDVRSMNVVQLHAMLVERDREIAVLLDELSALHDWRERRNALLKQCSRLHGQIEAMGDELQRYHEQEAQS